MEKELTTEQLVEKLLSDLPIIRNMDDNVKDEIFNELLAVIRSYK